MITVTFYYRKGQAECLEVEKALTELLKTIPCEVIQIDVDKDTGLSQVYGSHVPVVHVGPYVLKNPITPLNLEIAMRSAQDRDAHLTKADDPNYQKRLKRGHSFTALDGLILWLSHHYVGLFVSFLALFIGVSILAPVFLKAGWVTPAKVIYTIYSPLCHQLSFRSWFLFGEQAYYPRGLAGIPGIKTFEEVFRMPANVDENTDNFIMYSRYYEGDEVIGYKTALCQRDLAIYASFMLFGIIFAARQRKIKPVSWWIWLLLGVIPMAIDGVSQLPSLMAGLPGWLPLRESTPIFRTITGFLFGFTSAWYLFPFMEDSMQETRAILSTKKAVAAQSEVAR